MTKHQCGTLILCLVRSNILQLSRKPNAGESAPEPFFLDLLWPPVKNNPHRIRRAELTDDTAGVLFSRHLAHWFVAIYLGGIYSLHLAGMQSLEQCFAAE
ncbi:MAG: hypothetical protein ACUVTH_11850 [Thermogutta sp.]